MYQVENSGDLIKNKRNALGARASWLILSQTVWGLGFTSFFTDISSEMVATTLPVYLALVLRLAPFQLGIIDGLYQGAAILVKIIAGLWADRSDSKKHVAVAGYALSTLSRIGLLLSGPALLGSAWLGLVGTTLVDRIGKGIRTSPRDAMITASTVPSQLGTAFGAHRAMDTAGAMIGPLLASLLLWVTASAYDAVFVISMLFGVVGLAVLLFFVPRLHPAGPRGSNARPVNVQEMLRLLSDPRFRALLLAGGLLALATISDSLLHLTIQKKADLSPGIFPLLFVFVALVFMVLAVPMGRLADRMGRRRIFLAGYVLLGAAYGVALLPVMGGALLVAYVLLLGSYYAATDGVLMALLGGVLPDHIRTSGIALFTTFTGLARLVASLLFGAVWSLAGAQVAVGVFLVALLCIVGGATRWLKEPS